MSEQKIDRDAKAKEIVTLLNGLSRDEAMSILRVTEILINVNSHIDVSKKITDCPTVFAG
jgi:hypothetical protein